MVFQIGLNDSREGFSSQRIRNDLLEIQLRYTRAFPNARQHLTELPPLSDAQIEVNGMFRRLATHTASNLISTKQFRDRATGQLRLNTIASDGFHYNDVGVKILAKELKKSLFSSANITNLNLKVLNNLRLSACDPIDSF